MNRGNEIDLRKLDPAEISKLKDALNPLLEGKKAKTVSIYGSQVAGYARVDSDYDALVVLAPFHQKIKYYYLRKDVECSALVIDEISFRNDCSKSTLGEFVAGRLLNPYEVIEGDEFARENEVAYKQRVLLEGLLEAYAENSRFAEDIEYPLAYFLFEKLRKRAAIYPPVTYSYAMTYGGKASQSNIGSSLSGFREAALRFAAAGMIDYFPERDVVRVRADRMRGSGLGKKLSATAAYTARGIRQYAVHGYAGRVGINVIGREVLSKFERSKDHPALPTGILNPQSSWTIPGAKLFASSTDWLSDLLSYLGLDKRSTSITAKPLGEIYNSTSFYTLVDNTNSTHVYSLAVKKYNDIKGMKWGLLNLWSLKNTNFSANAMERMHREYKAIEQFRKLNLFTPSIVALFLGDKILVTQFIRGRDLSYIQSEYLRENSVDLGPQHDFGVILARVHGAGSCIGDTKPSNAILSDEDSNIYLTDLEQAHKSGNVVWDIAEFIYYSVRFTLKEDRARKLVDEFVSGYLDGGGDPKVIRMTSALRYRAPFQAFIAPNILASLRRDLARSG